MLRFLGTLAESGRAWAHLGLPGFILTYSFIDLNPAGLLTFLAEEGPSTLCPGFLPGLEAEPTAFAVQVQGCWLPTDH